MAYITCSPEKMTITGTQFERGFETKKEGNTVNFSGSWLTSPEYKSGSSVQNLICFHPDIIVTPDNSQYAVVTATYEWKADTKGGLGIATVKGSMTVASQKTPLSGSGIEAICLNNPGVHDSSRTTAFAAGQDFKLNAPNLLGSIEWPL